MAFWKSKETPKHLIDFINILKNLDTPNMGIAMSMSVFEPGSFDGDRFVPKTTFTPFPKWRNRSPGLLVAYYNALPPKYNLSKRPDNLMWWIDAQFMPYSDNTLVTSIGAYVNRGPGRTPIVISHLVQGLIYTITFTEQTSHHVLKGKRTSSMPYVQPHPSGDHICYVGVGTINICSLSTMRAMTREKELRNNNFRFANLSPNGLYIATLARVNMYFELSVLHQETVCFTQHDLIICHSVCPGFNGDRTYTERVECRFSPDSGLVAAGCSMGLLFVVRRWRLVEHCMLIPGMFDPNEVLMSNERSFEFDPSQETERILAFCDTNNNVNICNVDTKTIEMEFTVDTHGSLDSLKYSVRGEMLAVGTSEGQIHVYSPYDGTEIIHLDGTSLCPDAMMLVHGHLGTLPSILHMSFSYAGSHLAVSATDGIVRIWQLAPCLKLQHMCRLAILQHLSVKALKHLPLPSKLINYLYDWPKQQ